MNKKLLLFLLIPVAGILVFGIYGVYSQRTETSRSTQKSPAAAARQRVYIIGLDGASWNLMQRPLKEGKLPHFQKLIKTGSYGPLKSFVPTRSPVLWTSIATGKSQLKHGIGNFTAEKEGKMIPVSGGERITKAFWNILSDYGVRVGVVNWWVTWPPEKVNGFMVSDRYRNRKKINKDQLTYPPSLIQELPAVGISQKRYMEDREKFGLPKDLKPKATSKNIEQLASSYKTYWAQDKAVRQASQRLLAKKDVDVFGAVFRIIDVSSHLFWTYMDLELIRELREKLEKNQLTEQDIARADAAFTEIIQSVYIYADQIVGDFMRAADQNTHFIICSDHGFKFEEGRYGHSSMRTPPDGIVILNGPLFKKNFQIEGASLLDITPTLLYMEQIPVGRDMDGKIILSAFNPEFVKTHPPKVVDTHDKGIRQKGEAVEGEADEEILEDLRSLGYIQ